MMYRAQVDMFSLPGALGLVLGTGGPGGPGGVRLPDPAHFFEQ